MGVLVLLLLIQAWKNKHKLALKEKEQQLLIKDHLKNSLEIKEKELTSQVALLVQIQNKLEDLRLKASKILVENISEQEKLKKIRYLYQMDSFAEFKSNFDNRLTAYNEDFFKLLLKKYPDLSPSELKLCAYLRLNPTSKDLSIILNRSMRTVESTRTNIRKKMNLNQQENLVTHLVSITLE